jgi:hypothetical protein
MVNDTISVVQKNYKPPSKGSTRIYRLIDLGIDPHTKKLRCPNSQQIPNKFLIQDGETVKSYVYVAFQDPTLTTDSVPISQRGKIVFSRQSLGEIIIYGDRPEMFELDKALYFHQENKTNIGESWHVPPRTGSYTFERIDKQKRALNNVDMIERRIEAQNLVYKMDEFDLLDLYEVIFKTSAPGFTEDEMRSEIYEYLQKDDNVKAFLILKDDNILKLKKIIREAKTKNLIKVDKTGNSMVWSKGGDLLCTKLPRKTVDQSLMLYLITDEGKEVYKTLKELTEAKK